MKKRIAAFLLSALFILTCGCTPSDTETTVPDTEPQTVTDTETDAETEEEKKIKQAEITVNSLTVSDKISLDLTVKTEPEDLPGKLTVRAEAEDGKTVSADFSPKDKTELESPADGGIITVTASFVDADGEELAGVVLKTKDGLIQLTEDSIPLVVAEMTDEEKSNLVAGTGKPKKVGASGGTYEIERLGVPSITVNDGPAGVRYNTSVWYPSIMNITSSWDGELIRGVGAAIGGDSLALGIDIVLAPGMNIQKNVLGGRNFEYCAEDPLLTAYSATAYVNGMQSTGAGACLKHFAANEQETNRGSASSAVTERALREIYLKQFRLAVRDSSPVSVMSSYNPLNSVYTSISKDLLTGILRDEWNYKGMVMSDWGSAGAIEDKVNAQNDVTMPGNGAADAAVVLAGIKSGRVDREALDKCCEHILYAVTQSPTFRGLKMNTKVSFNEHAEVSEKAACDTMVLLKNEGALPFSGTTTVAVFGNGAYNTIYGGSGSGGVSPRKTVSIVKGIDSDPDLSVYNEKKNPFRRSEPHSKTDPSKDKAVTEDYAKECADGADAAVIVISRDSTEGADNSPVKGDWLLNDTEADMIRRVSEAFRAKGKKVVVLINTGSPVEVVSWRDLADAVVFIGYPGQNAGNAVAAVLSGKVNPSAKTTMTWPAAYADTPTSRYFPGNPGKTVYYEDIYVGYRFYGTFDVKTAYPFGYGLSYTEYEYSGFSVKENKNGTFTASVTVTNKGKTAGREIVQIYVSKPETTLEQPAAELCGFAKTALLQPGESETVNIIITDDALDSYDTQNSRYIVDSGKYTFYAASSAERMLAEASAEIGEMRVIYDVENRCVPSPDPDHIIKSEYRAFVPRSDDEMIAGMKDVRKSGKVYVTDLSDEKEVGEIYLGWDKLDSPYIVSVAGEDKEFSRFDVFASEGMIASQINLHGVRARYIRVEPIGGGTLNDIKVFPASDADKGDAPPVQYENLALKKRVKAASVEGGLIPQNAVDGKYDSRWGSLPSGESWLCVDLGEQKHVKGMMLYLEAAWVPYRVEYSNDNQNFETLASFGSGEIFVKLKDLDIECRYVRFIREGENWFSIYEAEIYGY